MISAIAKKRLAFRKADGSFITVKPGEFVSLPDEVRHDPMYAWAIKDGSLVVSEQVIAPVTDDVPAKIPEKVETAPVEEKAQTTGKGKSGGKGKTGTGKKAADK